jgi:2-polyprenyl-6-methoxyphenol hydroxylase-like FAD-dependent oxidoreductase
MASSRSIIIAGAGIGGLTAALALARTGYRSVVLEQALRLEETGAGIQLSPNATRVLIALGLGDRLRPRVIAPEGIRVIDARSGRDILRVPLTGAEARYGAPYWLIHRADLQALLVNAVEESQDVELRLGARVEDYALHPHGITVEAKTAAGARDEQGIALIGADGLWSTLRASLGDRAAPRFAQRTAWRAAVAAEQLAADFRAPMTALWLGRDAHLVHYPVKGGKLINIVAIVADQWNQPGWSAEGQRDDLLAHFAPFAAEARALLAQPERWQKWALFDRPVAHAGSGPVTLLGDAAHPVLPFLAQGAALAIEDAAVLAQCLQREPNDIDGAMRRYETLRRRRAARAQREAQRNGQRYHFSGLRAAARNMALRMMGGERLLHRYDWLYGWKP